MMKRSTPLLFALIGIVVWFAGCSVTDEGTPYPNQAPVTVLTYVPLGGDTINHYVTLYWSATDEDGDVVAFRVRVDDHAPVITTRHDTTIGFPAPIDSEVVYHTFAVSAIDNEGLEGPAASDSFYTINFVPTVAFDPDGSVPNGANVGTGFRVTVESADPNPSTLQYCLRLDDSTWNDGAGWNCSPNFVFLFASSVLHERPTDLTVVNEDDDGDGRIDEERENGADDDGDGAIDEDTQGLFPENTAIVPNAGLTPGAHTIYARVIDAGGAVSPAAMRNVTVLANQVPTMDTTTTGTYGGDNVYPDGSVYFAQNVETQLTFSANAAIYRGEINAYRYTVMAGNSVLVDWGEWFESPEFTFEDLDVGDYTFRVVARDVAGTLSDTVTYILHIVEQHLSTNIVIVDETRNGTGVPGSPSDEQVDAFYALMFDGQTFTQVDYTLQQYVSPLNLKDAGLVMWHADDKAELKLGDNTRILTEFLDKGGRLILSGHDLLGPFAIGPGDSVEYATTSFAYTKLRAISAARNTSASPRTSIGFVGENGFPTCMIDSTKLPSSFHGALDRVWTIFPRAECVTIGRLVVNNPGQNPYEGRRTAYLYDQSFRVAVFGVPLFFCYDVQVQALMDILIPQMMTGLNPPPG